MPPGLVAFALPDPLPVLEGALRMPVLEQTCPDLVLFDVLHVCPVEPLNEAWEAHVATKYTRAYVVRFAGTEE